LDGLPDEEYRGPATLRVGDGLREAHLTIGKSPRTPVKLSEPDPWGGIRLSGSGTPPWFH